jgi:hypothetical protein
MARNAVAWFLLFMIGTPLAIAAATGRELWRAWRNFHLVREVEHELSENRYAYRRVKTQKTAREEFADRLRKGSAVKECQ